jgi:SAM-dependent methyltransferase
MLTSVSWEYHKNQWENPKIATFEFASFISKYVEASSTILDLGTGAGAAMHQIASKYPFVNFIGVDKELELIEFARLQNKQSNCCYEVGDINEIANIWNKIDGIITVHTLSCLSGYEKFLSNAIENFDPGWIAISSLFYDGEIEALTTIKEFKSGRIASYNTYSIPQLNRWLKEFGWQIAFKSVFNLGQVISKPVDPDTMSTYTMYAKSGEEIQISGPILMNWYFLMLTPISNENS